jgi:hypothetical protein
MVGMSICYDLVFPETERCLALAGEALRVRAAENYVYLVV